MHDSLDVTTIVFAVLAIFVLFKLRSVLGTRTGNEQPPTNPFARPRPDERKAGEPEGSEASNVIRLPGAVHDQAASTAGDAAPQISPQERWGALGDAAAWDGLDAIVAADRSFSGKGFVDGARVAYEMIVTAFAAGKRDALKGLLAPDVFESFAGAIAAREERGETVETTFVSIEKSQITDAHLRGKTAQITMRFASKLITVTHDKTGAVIDGSPDRVVDVIDVWTFARESGSQDPNWKLVATESAHA